MKMDIDTSGLSIHEFVHDLKALSKLQLKLVV